MFRRVLFGIVAVMVVLALLVPVLAGLAGLGVTLGWLPAPQGVVVTPPEGGAVPFGYWGPYRFGPFGFGFGLFHFVFFFFGMFLLFGLLRRLFWGGHGGWGGHGPWGMHGPWGRHGPWGEHGLPPAFEEWHRRAHEPAGQKPPEGQQTS